ncbi:MAG TPA: thioredoxin domain-containing protein [Solirubrobacteraceae bacterium]|nr:thioredoxin domain-containing protein [Solirubrobacteraceae bacterium]
MDEPLDPSGPDQSVPNPPEPGPPEPIQSEPGPPEPGPPEPGQAEPSQLAPGPPEPDRPPRRRRRTRLWQLGATLAAVAAGIVAIAATSGAGVQPGYSGPHAATEALVASMLHGIPQQADALGSPTAPLTLQYFGDLECPYCREFTVDALPTIIARWVRTGKLRIFYRSFETATRQPSVFVTQQVAALAAAAQNKMWNYLELFYHEQGREDSEYVTERYLRGLAKQVPGLNLARWSSERANPRLTAIVSADNRTARHVHLPGTPGLFFGPTGGGLTLYRPSSLSSPAGFDRLIEALLARLNQRAATAELS